MARDQVVGGGHTTSAKEQIKTREDRRNRIKLRLRKRIAGDQDRPRLTVFRSLVTHLRAGDRRHVRQNRGVGGHTESSLKSGLSGKTRGSNKAGAELIGKTIAQRLNEKGIKKVVFDRNGYLYHGRIQAVADAARKAGLEF